MAQLTAADVSDLKVLEQWFTSAEQVRNWAGSRVSFPIESAKLPEEIEWQEAFSFRLCKEGALAGFGQLVPKPADRLHLARLIVDPEYRGKGYGRQLSMALVEEALSRRPEAISLNVFLANTPAIELYTRIGFVPATREPGDSSSQAQYMIYENLTGCCS